MSSQFDSRSGNRLSWLWLIAGAVLLAIGSMQTVVPLAAWLAPVFLLRFTRTQRALVGLPLLAVAGYVATLFSIRGFWSTPELYTFALAGVGLVVVYAADKLVASRLTGVWRTLAFPLADTSLSFLLSGGEFATMGNAAYTQTGNLPLVQLASVTGIWGIAFLIAWLAPVVNDLWEHGFDLRTRRGVVGLYAGVLGIVLLGGGLRLAFFAPSGPTVRVAALAPDRELNDAFVAAGIGPGARTAEERATLHAEFMAPLLDDLFARTREAAAGGAKIVTWAEAAGFAFKEDESAVLQEAQTVAREAKVYLEIAMVFILPREEYPFNENRAILFDPDGNMLWDYFKSTQPFGDGNVLGPGILPVVDTPYGRLTTAICYDADFPALVRQAGQANADIMLLPVSDWQFIDEMHARMGMLRAVENGMAIVRPARQGVSLAADHQGRLLGYKADYFSGSDHTMVVNVPVKGVSTLYALIGDSFAIAAVVAFVALAVVALAPHGVLLRVWRKERPQVA